MPATYTTRNASGKPPGGLKLPQRQQSTTIGSSIPVPSTSTVTENISSRKSLLPQRTIVHSRLPGLRKPQIQTQPTRSIDTTQTQPTRDTDTIQEQRREPPVETQPIPTPLPAEPPQPEPPRPEPTEDVKIPTPPPQQPVTTNPTNPTTITNRRPSRPRIEPRTERIATRSRSPVKSQQNDTKPVATKKPSMPPPARPTRSASLRQPSAPKISGVGGHSRHRSQVLGSQAISGTTPVLSAPSREKAAATTTVKHSRPQFTTYQQHFSPKKEKEAPRTVAAGTGKSVARSEVQPETVALQTEFLQLYLLHSSSLQQNAEWKSAAEHQLRDKYNEVAASYRTILDEERRIQEQLNLEALYDWSVESASLADHNHGVSFQEEIQSFSRVTQEVADMTAEGSGRYALAVQVFEGWLDRVEYIQRSRGNQDDEGDPQYIDTLGSVWRNEVDDLTIKAELCLRELSKMTIFVIDENEFYEKHGNSALVQIARKHRDTLMCMIDELKSIRAVESEMVNREQAWIARAADQVDFEADQGKRIRTGIWRTMT